MQKWIVAKPDQNQGICLFLESGYTLVTRDIHYNHKPYCHINWSENHSCHLMSTQVQM